MFCGNVKVMCFLLPTVPHLFIFGSFESIVIAHCAQQSQMFQDKSQCQYVHISSLRIASLGAEPLLMSCQGPD